MRESPVALAGLDAPGRVALEPDVAAGYPSPAPVPPAPDLLDISFVERTYEAEQAT
jgi:hypothetical protein